MRMLFVICGAFLRCYRSRVAIGWLMTGAPSTHVNDVWAGRLSHGTRLTQLLVGPKESIRGSGEDLGNFFYSLAHLLDWVPRNVIGISMLGSEFPEYSIEPSTEYFLDCGSFAWGTRTPRT